VAVCCAETGRTISLQSCSFECPVNPMPHVKVCLMLLGNNVDRSTVLCSLSVQNFTPGCFKFFKAQQAVI
jgi:hypothetical protein